LPDINLETDASVEFPALDTILPMAGLLGMFDVVGMTDSIALMIAMAADAGIGHDLVEALVVADGTVTALCACKPLAFTA
jgi:hypothetical protein